MSPPSTPPLAAPRRRATRAWPLAALLLACAGCALWPAAPAPAKKAGTPPPPWVAWPDAQVARAKNAHDYQGQPLCQRCHTGPEGGLKVDPLHTCTDCHAQKHGNHPVDVVHKTPARDLPYGEGGRVVCHTCHDPHDLKSRRKGLRLPFNELCLRCHAQH